MFTGKQKKRKKLKIDLIIKFEKQKNSLESKLNEKLRESREQVI